MDYDKNYIEVAYNPEELNEIFIKEFISFRKENNLTQDLFSKYSGVSREKNCQNRMWSLFSINSKFT